MTEQSPIDAFIIALPETAGSALYGMIDVLAATGTLWRELVGVTPGVRLMRPRIVSLDRTSFRCGNGIPVSPDLTLEEACGEGIVIFRALAFAR